MVPSYAGRLGVMLAAVLALAGSTDAQVPRPQQPDLAPPPPGALLVAPADGIGYHLARTRAQELLDEKRYAEAEPLAERIVGEYPRDGMNWVILARIKSGLKKHMEAAAAFERAGPLMGWGFWHSPRVNAAGEHVAAGNTRTALDLLRQEMFENRSPLRRELFDLPYLAVLRDDAEFREIAGRVDTAGWTRGYGWRRDIEYLRDEIKRVNPDYQDSPLPAEFERRYAQLWTRAPHLTDHQIAVGMNRMLAVLRQGHTSMFGFPGERRLPIAFYVFPEGVFVMNATEQYSSLLGARVLAIGDVRIEDALQQAGELLSVDGDMEYMLQVPTRLRQMTLLVGLGLSRTMDSATMTVQQPRGGVRSVTLGSIAEVAFPSNRLAPPPRVDAPTWLRNVARPHWTQAMPEHDAFYVQLNGIENAPDETLPEFGRRLWSMLDDAKPGNLIVDLRHNGGGATALYPEFLRTVIAFSRVPGHRVYVLIGRRTYSAAANLVTDLERLAAPTFVGEATSECCNFYGDPSPVVLPYSGISGVVTAVKWNLSKNVFDGRREMSPDVPVQLTAADYFAGRDPVLESVFRLIAEETNGGTLSGDAASRRRPRKEGGGSRLLAPAAVGGERGGPPQRASPGEPNAGR